MSAAWDSLDRHIREGDSVIAGTDFLGGVSPKTRAIMDSWEDPRGPEYSKAAIAARKAEDARRGPWHTYKANVVTLAAFAFTVGLMLGMLLI